MVLEPPALPSAFSAVVAERRLLKNLAYRLLGSYGAAEFAVRETYVRWYTMPEGQRHRPGEPLTWLVRTLVRICVDMLEPSPRPPRRWRAWRETPKL